MLAVRRVAPKTERMTEEVHPTLRPTAADRAEKALKALTSGVDLVAPGWGGFFGELVSSIIPNTAAQRLAEFVSRLSRRLHMLEARVEILSERLGPEQTALFEEGARSAVKATSSLRIQRLADLVAHGMTANEAEAERDRAILAILDQLSERDILCLDGFVPRMGRDPRLATEPDNPWADYGAGFQDLSIAEKNRVAREIRSREMEEKALEAHRVAKLLKLNLLDQVEGLLPGRPRLDGGLPLPVLAKDPPTLSTLGRIVLHRTGLGQATWEQRLAVPSEAESSA